VQNEEGYEKEKTRCNKPLVFAVRKCLLDNVLQTDNVFLQIDAYDQSYAFTKSAVQIDRWS